MVEAQQTPLKQGGAGAAVIYTFSGLPACVELGPRRAYIFLRWEKHAFLWGTMIFDSGLRLPVV